MRIRAAILALLGMLAVLGVATLAPNQADAAKVANPGSFTATVTDGFLRIKDTSFGFDPNNPITFTGTVASNGSVNIPESGQNYPPFKIDGGYTATIMPAAPITGTLNPLDGSVRLLLKVWIKIDGVPFGGGCRIASRANPIVVDSLITGTTSPPGPNQPITGTPYNTSNGTMKVVNNNFSVPSAEDCGFANGTVNSQLGLPSSSGNNEAQFVLKTNPILRKGITAALAVSGTSGVRPYTVDFDASGSTHAAPVRNYMWDFDGNGTFDRTTTTPTTSFTYTTAGVYNAKMRITDTDGDFADATRAITVNNPPDLTVDSTHNDPFRVGTQGRYNLSVRNLATMGPTFGNTTVTDTLPDGLEFVSASGTGWSCSAMGQTVTCARSGLIAANGTAPNIAIDVDVTADAIPGGTNTATVSTPGDSNSLNDTDTDPTTVTVIDVAIDKSHRASFRPGADPANVYELQVTNPGTAATTGPTVVTDSLPAGLTYVSATGTGFSCSASGQDVTCTRATPIPGGSSADPIELRVAAAIPEGQTSSNVVNTASVSSSGDAFTDNNSDSDPTLIIDSPDLEISKSHDGTFTAGGVGVYDLAVANVGPRDTTGTSTVTDTLPSGLTFRRASGTGWDCSAADQDVTCTRDDSITADTDAPSIELRVDVGREAIPSVDNTASVETPGDDNPANDDSTDTANVRAIDLTIDKSHEQPFRIGRDGTYQLRVENAGDSETVGRIIVTDTLPDGLTYESATGAGWTCEASGQDVTCTNDGPIAAGGAAATIDLRVAVGQAALPQVSNTATVATTDDFNPDNNSDTDPSAIVEADAKVSIRRTGSFVGGATGTYLVSVDNVGTTPTTGSTTLNVQLPAGLGFVSADGDGWSCSEDSGEVTCVRQATIDPESAVPDVSIQVSIDRDAPAAVTTVATVSTPDDRNPDNDTDSDTATVTGPDLSVSSDHESAFRVGSEGTYTLSVDNGGSRATRATTTVTDALPDGLELADARGEGWDCSASAQIVTCERSAEIAVDGSAPDITLDVRVRAAAAPSVVNSVSVSTAGDRDPSNDSDNDRTTVEAIDLRLRLDRDGPVVVGDEAVYQVAVDNVGTAATLGPARVDDTLPDGITPNEASGPGWACSVVAQEVSCAHDGILGPDEGAGQLTIRAHVGPGTAETATNSATVRARDDFNAANDTDSDETEVVREPDLKLRLDDQLPAGGSFRVGDDGTYRLSVINDGGVSTTSPARVSIELGRGMSLKSYDGGPEWACTANGRIVDCEYALPIPAFERRDLDLEVGINASADEEATTAAVVDTVGDGDRENDNTSRTSPITRIDLRIDRDFGGPWKAGVQSSYDIVVKSVGNAATVGPTLIREQLPRGVTLASATGSGWQCLGSGQIVYCKRPQIAAGATASPVRLTVDVGDDAVGQVTGTATVSTEDDVNASNNSATDTVMVAERDRVSLPAQLAMKRARPTANGIVQVRLRCPDASDAGCRGRVQLESATKLSSPSGEKRRKARFGSARFAISRGRNYLAPIRLSRRHLRMLHRHGRLRVSVTIATDGLPPKTASFTLLDR